MDGQLQSASRNITEVFIFLRNNARSTIHDYTFNDDHDRATLIEFDKSRDSVKISDRSPPQWINLIDEINYEFTRIRGRISSLKSLHKDHLTEKLDFSDDHSDGNHEKIKEFTDEITSMFAHCGRLIRLLEETENERLEAYNKLRNNVVICLNLALNECLNEFKSSQASYLRHLDLRIVNVDNFLLSSAPQFDSSVIPSMENESQSQELTLLQIQRIIENEHMTKEREREILKISKSILELNSMFKDVASLILDQGTILDRIDYNVEQTSMRVKSACKDIEKAEKYQRGRKMQLIVFLSGIALLLMLLILITKL